MGGKVWMRQMLASAFLLPAVVCGTAFAINFIAIYYHASRAIPFGTMVSLYVLSKAVDCLFFRCSSTVSTSAGYTDPILNLT
jgi:hypothetical protein